LLELRCAFGFAPLSLRAASLRPCRSRAQRKASSVPGCGSGAWDVNSFGERSGLHELRRLTEKYSDKEVEASLAELAETLGEVVQHYEKVCGDRGIVLPYSK
jgi:hypothetical protein